MRIFLPFLLISNISPDGIFVFMAFLSVFVVLWYHGIIDHIAGKWQTWLHHKDKNESSTVCLKGNPATACKQCQEGNVYFGLSPTTAIYQHFVQRHHKIHFPAPFPIVVTLLGQFSSNTSTLEKQRQSTLNTTQDQK